MGCRTREAKLALTFHCLKITDRLLSSNGIVYEEGAEKQGTEVRDITHDYLVMFKVHAHGIRFLMNCPHNLTESS